MIWKRSWPPRLLWPIASVSILTSCAWSMPAEEIEHPPYPPSLTRSCPPLGALKDGKAATVARALIDDAQAYDECASRHRRLVEAAEFRRALKSIEGRRE